MVKLYTKGYEVDEIDKDTFEIAKAMLEGGETPLAVVEALMRSKTHAGLEIKSALAVRIVVNANKQLGLPPLN